VAGGIYLRQGDKLVAMTEQPYATEDVLQQLLELYPELLAGDQPGAEPRRWLLVAREVSLGSDDSGAGRWLVDHLFLDQDAVPTLVEVKRSSDTRIRREVVGQMLDYAANAVVYWRVDALRATFEANCAQRGADPAIVLANVLDPDADADEFWIRVRTNFAAGRLRLVFVADAIPDELRRIVEFLDKQMVSTDVLAIEIKQYVDADGQHQTLVPRLVGRTEAARQTKGRSARVWNRESITPACDAKVGHLRREGRRLVLIGLGIVLPPPPLTQCKPFRDRRRATDSTLSTPGQGYARRRRGNSCDIRQSVAEFNRSCRSGTPAGDPRLPPPRPSDVHDTSTPRPRRSSIIGSASMSSHGG
jgi:hypothetical protein